MVDRCDPSKRKSLAANVKRAMILAVKKNLDEFLAYLADLLEVFNKVGFTFKPKSFSFVDKSGEEFPINYLSGHRMKMYKDISSHDIEVMANAANNMVQKINEITKYTDPRTNAEIVDRIVDYCGRRKQFISQHGDLMSRLVGKYPSRTDPNAYYYISNDPFDIFTKSTGRSWAPRNCERIFGEHQQGIFSDIEHNSAVVFIKDKRIKGFKSAVARLNLRLCIMYKKDNEVDPLQKYSIGWDINWYRGEHSHKRHHIYKEDARMYPLDLTGNQARIELMEIIHAAGFRVDYTTCTTPFAHEGFSDLESNHHVPVKYRSNYTHRCANCGTPERKDQMVQYREPGDDEAVEICKFCSGHHPAGNIFHGGRD